MRIIRGKELQLPSFEKMFMESKGKPILFNGKEIKMVDIKVHYEIIFSAIPVISNSGIDKYEFFS